MIIELPSLPYSYKALEPYISAKTMRVHHDTLQRNYVTILNRLVRGTKWDHLPLEQIIMDSDGDIFNNAAQCWNHTFFWSCMKPKGGGVPSKNSGFGYALASHGDYKQTIKQISQGVFGSAWLWITAGKTGEVLFWIGEDGDNPMRYGYRPLLCIDLWEHAFFIDYPGKRAKFVEVFLDHLVNWRFAEANYQRAFGI